MKVTFQNICKHYGEVKAVDDVSLTIEDGALHFLLGPSGCGKTTALRILAGLETPTAGKILFDKTDVTNFRAVERQVGMVFQNYALWPHMTVYKNVEYGLKVRKDSKSDRERKISEVLALTQLQELADRLPGQLSGGQQQRVALARAIALTPNVLLLDEPLSNLDAKLRREMRANLLDIHKKTKITTIYVTHDQKEALTMGSSITVMQTGKILQTGTPRNLYNKPLSPFLANFIGETNIVAGKVFEKCGIDTYRIGTEVGELFCKSEENLRGGEKLHLSIRPEAIHLAQGNEQENVLHLQLRYLTYLGAYEQLLLTTGEKSKKVIIANIRNQQEFVEGKAVDIHIKPEAVLIFRESS